MEKWRGGGSNTQFEANNKFSMPIHDESSRQLKLEAEPHKNIQNNFQFIVVAFGKKRGPNILLLVRADEKINSRFNFIIHSMGVAAQTQIQLELRFKIYEIEMVSGISNKSSLLERMKKLLRRDGWRYRGAPRERKMEENNVHASKLRMVFMVVYS
ncbi:uncharacterized protein LOC111241640 [Vigna radiata var. radiata]|uniref:Uncharacterized protein LOC111241640 n=1 Tax=Vigna radiata var. radiata TaxID=3916 RepID=A0A3Q0EWG0_VIGRR|nr:uncharacterized protein LOC111241640 [Vigna radiata var. radiata]